MSIFPTTILLATDASEESVLAAETAVDLSQKTASELHVVYVRKTVDNFDDFFIVSIVDDEDLRRLDTEAQELLDAQVKQIYTAGGMVTQAHLRVGRPKEIVGLGRVKRRPTSDR